MSLARLFADHGRHRHHLDVAVQNPIDAVPSRRVGQGATRKRRLSSARSRLISAGDALSATNGGKMENIPRPRANIYAGRTRVLPLFPRSNRWVEKITPANWGKHLHWSSSSPTQNPGGWQARRMCLRRASRSEPRAGNDGDSCLTGRHYRLSTRGHPPNSFFAVDQATSLWAPRRGDDLSAGATSCSGSASDGFGCPRPPAWV
jgi:hypothetical protein